MKSFKYTIQGYDYEVDIISIEDNIAEIEVNSTKYIVELHREVKKTKTPRLIRSKMPTPTSKESKITKSKGKQAYKVIAPLPGTIIRVLVNEGDEIRLGQKLLIMEAMKMENEVLAEKAGYVNSIEVVDGDTVLQNDVLIEII